MCLNADLSDTTTGVIETKKQRRQIKKMKMMIETFFGFR